ncbi:MAG: hypothetical protein ACE5G2_10780 [Candidatus Krumholzibacteriia bacterium]
MNARRGAAVLLLGASLLLGMGVLGCGETGPQGPPGPSALESCFNCHGDSPGAVSIGAITTEYEMSMHHLGHTFERKTSPCNGCHTHEGFVQRVTSGEFPAEAVEHASKVNCWTCHAPHTTGTFSVRTNAAVSFLDGSGEFDAGMGNLCAHCHQSRGASPPVPAEGQTMTPPHAFWGPHHGTQANILAGTGGFPRGMVSNSPHTLLVEDACVTCHMVAPPSSGTAGGHTWSVTYDDHGQQTPHVASCNAAGCHESEPLSDFDFHQRQTEIAALIDTVRAALLTAGAVDDTDHVIAGRPYTRAEAQAVWNYLMVLEDGSRGVHNTNYARALLQTAQGLLGVQVARAARPPGDGTPQRRRPRTEALLARR